MTTTLGVLLLFFPSETAAQTCYIDKGNLSVDARAYACPPPSTTRIYTLTNGTVINGSGADGAPRSLSATWCFTSPVVSQGATTVNYRQEDCQNLETLRLNAAKQACESSDGTWVTQASGTTTRSGCDCPGTQTVNNSGTCTSQPTTDPERVSEPEPIPNDCNEENINKDNCGIISYIVIIINFLSAIVGIVVTASIIYGGIQYSMAGGDPQKVSAAKQRIRNALIALVFFIFTYSFLNYLVPGGVF